MSDPTDPGQPDEPVRPPEAEQRTIGPRFGAAGVPMERSKDLKNSSRRLAARLRPERAGVAAVLLLTVVSVVLLVYAPRLLGNATNIPGCQNTFTSTTSQQNPFVDQTSYTPLPAP